MQESRAWRARRGPAWRHQERKARRGPAGSPAPGPRSPPWWRPPSSWPTWLASGSSPAWAFRSRTSPRAFPFCCYGRSVVFPRSSGEYNFLSRAFHPAFGFLAGWVSATVGFAAPVALAAMAFGEYGKAVLPGVPPLALAIGIVWLVSIVQLTGVRHSSTFQLISTVLKVALIVAFLIAGFVIGA